MTCSLPRRYNENHATMTIYAQYQRGGSRNPMGPFAGMIILVLILVALYFIAKGIFTILSFAAPVLFVLSLIIDYTATVDFVKFIVGLFKNNILYGILAVLLTILGFPIVAGFLFFRSIIRRKLKGISRQMEERRKGEFADYEIIEENTDEDFLELPELEEQPPEENSEYDDLFK